MSPCHEPLQEAGPPLHDSVLALHLVLLVDSVVAALNVREVDARKLLLRKRDVPPLVAQGSTCPSRTTKFSLLVATSRCITAMCVTNFDWSLPHIARPGHSMAESAC